MIPSAHAAVLLIYLLALSLPAAAAVRVPSIFGSEMVFQRNQVAPVWGWAEPGEQVTVEFASQLVHTTADTDGSWKVALAPLETSFEGRTLTIRGDRSDQRLRFDNILVGEIWILAGQSNMGWPVSKSLEGDVAQTRANYPWLRIFRQSPNEGASDERAPDVKNGTWTICTPATAATVSAVGFFFAESLHPHLSTPVALVHTQMGATWIESWIDPSTLATLPGSAPYAAMIRQAQEDVAAGTKKLEDSLLGVHRFRRPGGLYNGKVAPLQPFAIRGVLWYQGEGNANRAMAPHYFDMLSALVGTWRRDWQQGDFPFIIVQLPRFAKGTDTPSWPLLREMQLRASRALPNTGLVVTIDTGERDDIHPPEKRPVGKRTAKLARALVYGEHIEGRSPQLEHHEIKGRQAILHFSHVDTGLKTQEGELRGFEICGNDRIFKPAQAQITNSNTVVVTSTEVSEAIAVRYAWAPFPEANLVGGGGLPASPFRTDTFASPPLE